jgi:hypothetical protein
MWARVPSQALEVDVLVGGGDPTASRCSQDEESEAVVGRLWGAMEDR